MGYRRVKEQRDLLLDENKRLTETIKHFEVGEELKAVQLYIASLKAQIIEYGGIPKEKFK